MSSVIATIERAQLRRVPNFTPGDRVKVHFQVIEGARRRVQVFEGVVIKRQGHGARETFTVRKQSFGVGVERMFPVNSPKRSAPVRSKRKPIAGERCSSTSAYTSAMCFSLTLYGSSLTRTDRSPAPGPERGSMLDWGSRPGGCAATGSMKARMPKMAASTITRIGRGLLFRRRFAADGVAAAHELGESVSASLTVG